MVRNSQKSQSHKVVGFLFFAEPKKTAAYKRLPKSSDALIISAFHL